MESPSAPKQTTANPQTPQKAIPLAYAMLQEIQAQRLDPKSLSDDKRRLCVRALLHQQSYTVYEIAELMGVHRMTITRDKKKIRDEDALGQLVIDESVIAQDMLDAAELHAARLTKAGKHKDAWTVRKECVELLQSLGYVKKVAQGISLKGTVSLLEVLEVDRLTSESDESNGIDLGPDDAGGNDPKLSDDRGLAPLQE